MAGPGSGKTHTITSRIRYLVHEMGVPPERILVITFTKEAAVSMEKRFLNSESSEGTLGVCFGTFHSFFYSILRLSAGYDSGKLLSDPVKTDLIKKIISKILQRTPSIRKLNSLDQNYDAGEYASEFIKAMSFYKNSGDEKSVLKNCSSFMKKHFCEILDSYENIRQRKKLLDFDDMIFECNRVLKSDKEIRNQWIERFDHILVDEYQDINPFQFETLDLLIRDDNGYIVTNVFAVGDDDQSIYGFRGSEPKLMKRFVKEYDSEVIRLDINYRSGSEIISFAEKVIEGNKDRFSKKQTPFISGKLGKVAIKQFKEQQNEYEYLSRLIQDRKVTKGVLFRTNLAMQSFASFLTGKGISYTIKEKSRCVYDHPVAEDVLSYLAVIEDPKCDSLYKIINKPVRYISREALYPDGIRSAIRYYKLHSDRYKVKDRLRDLETLYADLNFLQDKMLYLQVKYIRSKIGLEKHYSSELKRDHILEEYMAVLDFMEKESRKFDSLQEWLAFIEVYREEFAEKQKKVKDIDPYLPQIMTVHASKGLEFDNVYIPSVNEGNFPHGRMPDNKTIEEERRIFYVAITRAKENLYLSYSSETPPSRFVHRGRG